MATQYCLMLAICLLMGCITLTTATATKSDFDAFIETYGRNYKPGSEEYKARLALFQDRAAKVEFHNRKSKRLWTAGINELTDWSEDELRQLRGWRGIATSNKGSRIGAVGQHSVTSVNLRQTQNRLIRHLPKEKSWTDLSSLQTVHNQGGCGSCWAVTAATVLDAHSEIYAEEKMVYSAQDMVSCVPNKRHCGGDGGCEGATVELAYDWAMFNRISSAENSPYKAEDLSCVSNKASEKLIYLSGVSAADGLDARLTDQEVADPGAHWAQSPEMPGLKVGLYGWERLPENQYEPLMRAVAEVGPVAVSVAASAWSNYAGGIFDGCSKNAIIDHAVTLVGYGKEDGNGYWQIQNSWGAGWGERGRIRLLRQDTDWCGTDNQPDKGTGCDGGPAEVEVCGMCGILYDTVVPHFRPQNESVTLGV